MRLIFITFQSQRKDERAVSRRSSRDEQSSFETTRLQPVFPLSFQWEDCGKRLSCIDRVFEKVLLYNSYSRCWFLPFLMLLCFVFLVFCPQVLACGIWIGNKWVSIAFEHLSQPLNKIHECSVDLKSIFQCKSCLSWRLSLSLFSSASQFHSHINISLVGHPLDMTKGSILLSQCS
jgi:hypothetical protein